MSRLGRTKGTHKGTHKGDITDYGCQLPANQSSPVLLPLGSDRTISRGAAKRRKKPLPPLRGSTMEDALLSRS